MSGRPTVSYAIVTPVRDEAGFIGDLAGSLLTQTVPFSAWVVVDDGSTDGTVDLVRGLAARDPRIALIERGPRLGGRAVGIGGIETAMVGFRSLPLLFSYDFVANIDADLLLPPDYFEGLFTRFAQDPSLGIAGGHLFVETDGGLELDRVPDEHVHGATKVYRRECLSDIWPLAEVWGWDAVDEGRAQILGWKTQSFLNPAALHRKPMSGGTGDVLKGRYVCGRTCHFLGYRTDFALARAGMHLFRKPYVIGGVAMAWGYLSGVLSGAERIDEPAFVTHLRATQAARLKRALWPSADMRASGEGQ